MTPARAHDIIATMRLVTEAFTQALAELAPKFEALGRALAPIVRRIMLRRRFWLLRANDVRPNGKRRRSGHRHRGTAAWERRHGTLDRQALLESIPREVAP